MTEAYPLDADGVWCEVIPGCCRGAPALFLDRDGVVVEEVDYLHRVDDIHFCPDATAVISAANANAIPVVLVTNQAGIGRGYYGWAEFCAIQQAIQTSMIAFVRDTLSVLAVLITMLWLDWMLALVASASSPLPRCRSATCRSSSARRAGGRRKRSGG